MKVSRFSRQRIDDNPPDTHRQATPQRRQQPPHSQRQTDRSASLSGGAQSMVVSVLIRRPIQPRNTPSRCVCRLRFSHCPFAVSRIPCSAGLRQLFFLVVADSFPLCEQFLHACHVMSSHLNIPTTRSSRNNSVTTACWPRTH